jgi:serine/threonine protein kinase
MIGTKVLHYEILEKLGEGGMGVVYKARDTKLDRFVALKFLPAHLNASEQDKARFVQEAKAAAALNHPNVCSVIDISEHEGTMFIVMEYVDGQTLREKKSSLGFKQSIETGIQIAEGLAAAHEKGIVHRDIKPDNIMIRKDGIAQIMDFGLAKLRAGGSKINRLTKEGSTVGTAGYMSPEQVQGLDVDHRSDIFSLGVVLYELFTGQLPFRGVHETALAYEIVNVDPQPMASLKPDIDPNLDAIVLDCLDKEPRERTQSAAQVAIDLKRYRRESSRQRASRVTAARPVYSASSVKVPDESAVQQRSTAVTPHPSGTARLPWIVAAICFAIACVLGVLYFMRTPAAEPNPVRFSLFPPEKGSFEGDAPVVSPDGRRIVFVARDSTGNSMIWMRNLATLQSTPMAGTENGTYPFWSPDSRFLAFFRDGKMKKIEVNGGPALSVTDAADGRGGSWGSSGVIIFSPNYASGIFQVSEAGGKPTALTTLDTARREESHRWPHFLPDGRRFVYLNRSTDDEKTGVYLGSLDSPERSLLLPAKSNAVYVAPGFLLFVRERSLMAQGFDPEKGELRGDAFPITDATGLDAARGIGSFSASDNGVIAFGGGGGSTGDRQLVWYDRSGKRLEKAGSVGNVYDLALSPDEKRVVFRRLDQQTRNQDLWILDLLRGTESRFTFATATDDDPVWSPDGLRILFDSNPDGVPSPFVKIASGAGSEQPLLKLPLATLPLDWSSDGRFILIHVEDPRTRTDLWALPTFGDKKPFPVVQTAAEEDVARFSPDGKWIVYQSDESGKSEIYVQAFPVSQGKWQISINGGGGASWSKDGREIYFLSPNKKLMAVDVRATGASIEQGIPRPVFDTNVDVYTAPNRYAASKDGKRFLVNTTTDADNTRPITVVLNWISEMKKQ